MNGSLGFGLLWFLVILAAIPLVLWLVKRTPYGAAMSGGVAGVGRLVGTLPLGPHQKLVTVEVGQGEERRWLVSSEGAFSYLARDFGLKELYIWPINADQQGTPQQVRKVIDLVREHDVPAVFSESTVPADAAEQIARETGAAYGGVLYVDSLSEPDGPVPSYLDMLRVTAATITEALAP